LSFAINLTSIAACAIVAYAALHRRSRRGWHLCDPIDSGWLSARPFALRSAGISAV